MASTNAPRVALWDNARFIAIVLVVLGHALTKMVPESQLAFSLYLWIYAFHIPLFVALAGYFSRADPLGRSQLTRLLTDLLAPYLIFELIWSTIASLNSGTLLINPLQPNWTLWFLLSLLAWRVVLPFIALLRWPLALSVIVSVGSGYLPVDQTLSLSRTLGFLPLFVLGWWAADKPWSARWMAAGSRTVSWVRAIAGVVLAALFVAIWLWEPALRAGGARKLVTYDQSFVDAGFDAWWAGLLRLAVLLLAVVMIIALLALVPRGTTWFSGLGAATMYIYLLHSFVIAPLRAVGLLAGEPQWWLLVLLLPGCVALSWLLGSRLVQRLTRPLIQPSLSGFLRRPEESKT